MHRSTLGLVAAGLLLQGCTGLQGMASAASGAGLGGLNAARLNQTTALNGTVSAPLAQVAPLSQASALNQTSAFRTAAWRVQDLSETPVASATVTVLDPNGFPVPGAATTTDAQGRYTLAVPVGMGYFVRATLSAAGKTLMVMTFANAGGSQPTVPMSLDTATTLVAEAVFVKAHQQGTALVVTNVPNDAFQTEAKTVYRELGTTIAVPDLTNMASVATSVGQVQADPGMAPLSTAMAKPAVVGSAALNPSLSSTNAVTSPANSASPTTASSPAPNTTTTAPATTTVTQTASNVPLANQTAIAPATTTTTASPTPRPTPSPTTQLTTTQVVGGTTYSLIGNNAYQPVTSTTR